MTMLAASDDLYDSIHRLFREITGSVITLPLQVLEQFLRVKNLVLHHIILNMECVAIPISMHNNTHPEKDRNYYNNSMMTMPQRNVINNIVPNNLHTIIGPRLPNLVCV